MMRDEIHVGATGPALLLRGLKRHRSKPAFVGDPRRKSANRRIVEDEHVKLALDRAFEGKSMTSFCQA
jgi:hypothetical protein